MSQPAPVVLAAFSTGTFSLAATPAVQTVAAGTNASFGINVTAANGFSGDVSFVQYTTKPSCATYVTFPSSVGGSGGTTLVLGTSQCAPGTYPVNIVGTSNSITNSVAVYLVVQGPPAPATVTGPSTQTVLSGDSAVFTWTAGSQVSQYQLDLTASDDGTVCSPRYAGNGQLASMSLSACCKVRPRVLTAKLGSQLS